MEKHHDLSLYERLFLGRLQNSREIKYGRYVNFRIKLILFFFLLGNLALILTAVLCTDLFISTYILCLVCFIPTIISTWLNRKWLFFYLRLNVKDERAYFRPLPKWILWFLASLMNLIVIGSFCLLILTLACYTLADEKALKETVRVKNIKVHEKSKLRTASIVFEDGALDSIVNIDLKIKNGKDWVADSEQTIWVKKSLFGSKILVE